MLRYSSMQMTLDAAERNPKLKWRLRKSNSNKTNLNQFPLISILSWILHVFLHIMNVQEFDLDTHKPAPPKMKLIVLVNDDRMDNASNWPVVG